MEFDISTNKKIEMIDITDRIKKIVEKSGVKEGVCVIFLPHSTAAIVINENEPKLIKDFENTLGTLLEGREYIHEKEYGHTQANLWGGMLGPEKTVIIEEGKIKLGTWQRIFLCELDGPRDYRKIKIKIIEG